MTTYTVERCDDDGDVFYAVIENGLLVDGFDTQAEANAFCEAHNSLDDEPDAVDVCGWSNESERRLLYPKGT